MSALWDTETELAQQQGMIFGEIYVQVTWRSFVICNITPNKLKQNFTPCYISKVLNLLIIAASIYWNAPDMLMPEEFYLMGYNAV
jgi:hypothetical protein